MEDAKRIVDYRITANGVYRCCKYLLNLTFREEENGWTKENPAMKRYSYKNIQSFLRENYPSVKLQGKEHYDGERLWTEFFLKDACLLARIEYMRISDIASLHYYANNAANGRKQW